MRTKWLILLAAMFLQLTSLAQSELGLPFIRTYSPTEYRDAPQNLCIVQDHRGMMYIANNAAVLEYDGTSWRSIKVTNKTSVLSVAIDSNDIVYAGAQAELGYLQPDKQGYMEYVSLMPKVPAKDKVFNDVWQVIATRDGIFFRTDKNLLLYKNGAFKVFYPAKGFLRMYQVYGRIYLMDAELGLTRFENGKFVKVKGSEALGRSKVYAMFPYTAGNILVATTKDLFIYDPAKDYQPFVQLQTGHEEELHDASIYQGAALPGGKFVLTTIRNGIYVFGNNGVLLQHITKKSGLQDDISTYAYLDREKNLWIAHNNGLSRSDITSPLSFFDYARGLHGEVEAITRYEGSLYAGTFQGIYVLDPAQRDSVTALPGFRLIPGSGAQSFCFAQLKEPGQKPHLYIGSVEGISEVVNGECKYLWSQDNAIRMLVPEKDSSMLVLSGAAGLYVFRLENGKLNYLGKQPLINDLLYNVVEDSEGFWVGTAYNGLYRCKGKSPADLLDTKNVVKYDSLKGVPMEPGTYLWKWDDKVVLNSQTGLLEYDSRSDRFVKTTTLLSKEFLETYPQSGLVRNDYHGGTWMVAGVDDYTGLMYITKEPGGKTKWEDAPFRRIPPMSVIWVEPERNNIVWIGGSEGLMRYDNNIKTNTDIKYNVVIRKVKAGKDSVLFAGNNYITKIIEGDTIRITTLGQDEERRTEIPYANNTLLFEFSALNFFDERSNKYSYFLEGFDADWSAWSTEAKKEYTNVPPGTYTFRVKAISLQNIQGTEATYTFTVLPPWYRTAWAYALYALLFILLLYLLVKLSVRRLTVQKEKLERIVQQRTVELREEKELVEKQKNSLSVAYREIEQKNKDITDSINYARRIQEAMLPSAKRMSELLPDSFVFYQPKDIISGDFYWFGEKNGKCYVAAADCTGHGVPGALMSMIGINFLNQLVNEQQLGDTAEILNRLHLNVLRALNEDITLRQSKDGMDIALVCIDRAARTVQYSGAVRPLYYVMKDELKTIKGDRFSIGGIKNEDETFTSHVIDYESPVSLYMFSDGYIDQFGGPGGKKFMAKKLQELITRIYALPVDQQKAMIEKVMSDWRTGVEQVDDMLVLGVKL